MDINNVKVPVEKKVEVEDSKTGRMVYKTVTEYEALNPHGKQSDGSQYFFPEKLVADDHEHLFALKNPSDRQVICDCGFGGDVFPHNTVIKDGHVYDLNGNKVA